MADRDDVVRAALERHAVPPERSDFFDELWELVQAREHAAAVRWRRISIVLAVVALAAVSAASVLAAPHRASAAVDATTVCALGVQGGLPVFDVGAEPLAPPQTKDAPRIPGSVIVTTSGNYFEGTRLFMTQGGSRGYLLDNTACRDTHAKVALNRLGLAPAGIFRTGFQGVDIRCLGPARVLLRVRMTTNSKGLPTHVQLAARNARTNKPLAFVDWTESLVRAYASTTCRVSDI